MRGEYALWFLGVALAFAVLEAWLRRRSGRGYDRSAALGTLGVAGGQIPFNGLAGVGTGAGAAPFSPACGIARLVLPAGPHTVDVQATPAASLPGSGEAIMHAVLLL